ncbi:hypothetical protein HQ576_09090 [bacterium]|nr:hypothetical protein [bacterium]
MGVAMLGALQGCTFFALSGGGPLKREELGNWAGMGQWPPPEPRSLRRRVQRLKTIPVPAFRIFGGEYGYTEGPHWIRTGVPDAWDVPLAPVHGYQVRGTCSLWLRLVPSQRGSHWLYSPLDEGQREFYAGETAWGMGLLIGDFLFSNTKAQAFDTMRCEHVAAQQLDVWLGWGIGSTRVRRVLPVDADGKAGLHALADPKKDVYDVRYDLRDGRTLLFGLLGWGRVNRRHYLQLLWIPIPLGKAAL